MAKKYIKKVPAFGITQTVCAKHGILVIDRALLCATAVAFLAAVQVGNSGLTTVVRDSPATNHDRCINAFFCFYLKVTFCGISVSDVFGSVFCVFVISGGTGHCGKFIKKQCASTFLSLFSLFLERPGTVLSSPAPVCSPFWSISSFFVDLCFCD